MSEKTLKRIIYILGSVSFFIWLSVRFEPLFNLMLKEKILPDYWENTKWGELYYFNFIGDFREKDLPPCDVKYRNTPKHPSLEQADILLFGDSFFDFTRMTTFPEQLSDSLGKKVFYARYDKPLSYLDEHNYTNSSPRLLVYETAERFFDVRFAKPQPDSYYPDNRPFMRKAFDETLDFAFARDSEIKYDQLLCRSYLTYDIHSFINTLKFKLFGYITDQTPVYSTKQKIPWLFINSEVSKTPQGYFYNHSSSDIRNYCDNIKDLSVKLKERYNLDLVFLIIPNKFTIYHNVVDTTSIDYGNLIPKLYAELENRGIPVIKIYNDYLAERENKLLFFGTDTHWTEDGLRIALNRTINKLDSLSFANYQVRLKPDHHKDAQLNPQHANHKSTY